MEVCRAFRRQVERQRRPLLNGLSGDAFEAIKNMYEMIQHLSGGDHEKIHDAERAQMTYPGDKKPRPYAPKSVVIDGIRFVPDEGSE